MRRAALLACVVSILAFLGPGFARAEEPTPTGDPSLPVKAVRAFPKLRLRRPVFITHAGDGTNRLFVVSQFGTIYVMPNDESVMEPATFLDIEEQVQYTDKQNEEGLLGLAFHPKYKQNGKFYLYYTTSDAPHTSVISEWTVSKSDPNAADPGSERELLRIKQPFWNHNGGTIVFGPDGYLYVGLGDGGAANDPQGNGQNLGTLLGSILRIDVDAATTTKAYGIPKDNPFVDKEGARPEIYAYGVRNVWRLSFDRKTGQGWFADVGQNLWEEIDLLTAGGNYGWNLREGRHKFMDGAGPREDLIEPIWEYHHSIGKSITGGYVYRGQKVPALQGKYLYADYVTGLIWALDYDMENKRVQANYRIPSEAQQPPVMTFGEDEQGEVYFGTTFGMLYKFVPSS